MIGRTQQTKDFTGKTPSTNIRKHERSKLQNWNDLFFFWIPQRYCRLVMSLEEQYRRQYQWRDWKNVLDRCPIVSGSRFLDLGCAVGDISEEILQRGAHEVVGVDGNASLLGIARSKCLEGLTLIESELNTLEMLDKQSFDGIWCSFTIAYFTPASKASEILQYWKTFLKPTGWICLVEMSDLLNHDPISQEHHEVIDNFYEDAYEGGRYDFKAGGKLRSLLQESGFNVIEDFILKDDELSGTGPVSSDVVVAWQQRFRRMGKLRDMFSYMNNLSNHFYFLYNRLTIFPTAWFMRFLRLLLR